MLFHHPFVLFSSTVILTEVEANLLLVLQVHQVIERCAMPPQSTQCYLSFDRKNDKALQLLPDKEGRGTPEDICQIPDVLGDGRVPSPPFTGN
jgi:hypothetical protein